MATFLNFCNGMFKVAYQRRANLKTCSLGVFVGAGSRNEEANENGIAHFIEHMIFKGTERRSAYDIAAEADSLGANINAYTTKSNTVFYITGLSKNIDKFMDILSDMLFNSTFKEEEIEREKGVVVEEIKMYDDDGESVCSDLLSEKFFDKDPLARPIIGTEETVKSFNADMIHDFMDRYYYPQNILMVYVGPATEEMIADAVNKTFAPIIESKGYKLYPQMPKFDYRKPVTKPIYATNFTKPFEQANVKIRFPAFPASDKRTEGMSAAVSALGAGMSSRLFQKVREERGLVYDVYVEPITVSGAGYVDICFATAPNLVEKAILAIREVLTETAQNGFTNEEYEKARIQRETSVMYAEEGTFDEMRFLGRHYFLLDGKLMTFAKKYEKFRNMTLAEMNSAFESIFRLDEASVCYVGKEIDVNLFELLKKGEVSSKNE